MRVPLATYRIQINPSFGFQEVGYMPLKVKGSFKSHIVAFARGFGEDWAVTIAPRFLTSLVRDGEDPLGSEVWDDTEIILPEGSPMTWRESISAQTVRAGGSLAVGDALRHFPAALLIGEGQE